MITKMVSGLDYVWWAQYAQPAKNTLIAIGIDGIVIGDDWTKSLASFRKHMVPD